MGVTAALGVGAVLAQSGENGTSDFLDRVAAKLGVEPDRLEQAITDTRKEDIDAAVARGDLTEEQADRLKTGAEDFDGGWPPSPRGPRVLEKELPHFGKDWEGPGHDRGFGYGFGFGLPGSIDALAAFLGTTPEGLRGELAEDGATLAMVAEAHGKSRDELKIFISDNASERLAAAVAEGILTQEMAGRLRERLDGALNGIVDAEGFGGRGQFEFRFHHDFGAESEKDEPGKDEPSDPQGGRDGDAGRS
jgi:hypothetical protein